MGYRPWWFDAVQASMHIQGVPPWEWLRNSERVQWMYRTLDTIAADKQAQKNRGG